ncbi:phage portal protein [Treponema pectinovorum]|uniref:phage portal protein n=1 Tax=Treponema pectinovorum TaxID=164 RepID=UPI00164D2C51|nr:phage portal protein [Treponema pectinovorum]
MKILGFEITKTKNKKNEFPQDYSTGTNVFYYSPKMTVGELMANTTVNSCVNIISDAVASLSCNVYERSKDGREKDGKSNVSKLLKYSPNAEDTHYSFFQQVMLHLLLRGNAFIYVERNNFSGEIISLRALDPEIVEIKRDENHALYYVVTTDHGYYKYKGDNILHIPAIKYNRPRGFAPLEYASHSARTGLKLEEYTSDYFDNGIHSKFLITAPQTIGLLSKEQRQEISQAFRSAYGGKEKANEPIVMAGGFTGVPISWAENKNAQLVENRAFTEKEIAKIFRVPLFMLGSEGSKFNNMEQSNTYFLQHTLTPWIVKIQERLTLLLRDENKYIEFDTNTMLRADYATRWANYRENFKNGLFTLNQILDMENMPRVKSEIGDKHFMQAQYLSLEDNNKNKEKGENSGNLNQ